MLTVEAVARRLPRHGGGHGVSRAFVRRLLNRGVLDGRRMGHGPSAPWLVFEESVARYVPAPPGRPPLAGRPGIPVRACENGAPCVGAGCAYSEDCAACIVPGGPDS